MKVYITQGHEKGIGLEVLFKSLLMLSDENISQLTLIAYPESVKNTLDSLFIKFTINDQQVIFAGLILDTIWLDQENVSQSFTALELGMKLAESGGVLYTLPTSKDQFPNFPGHTEYFRHFYRNPHLGMFFSSAHLQLIILTDHLPVERLSATLTEEFIFARIDLALRTLRDWNWPTNHILISGFNPHAGENGLIGSEDERINQAISRLELKYKLTMEGPIPADTMYLGKSSPHDLLVYLYHDQGLGIFKATQGYIGSNITLGLPYPRVSPDHGTSFKIFGKNQADYRGCEFSLKQALVLLKRVTHGKNTSHKS